MSYYMIYTFASSTFSSKENIQRAINALKRGMAQAKEPSWSGTYSYHSVYTEGNFQVIEVGLDLPAYSNHLETYLGYIGSYLYLYTGTSYYSYSWRGDLAIAPNEYLVRRGEGNFPVSLAGVEEGFFTNEEYKNPKIYTGTVVIPPNVPIITPAVSEDYILILTSPNHSITSAEKTIITSHIAAWIADKAGYKLNGVSNPYFEDGQNVLEVYVTKTGSIPIAALALIVAAIVALVTLGVYWNYRVKKVSDNNLVIAQTRADLTSSTILQAVSDGIITPDEKNIIDQLISTNPYPPADESSIFGKDTGLIAIALLVAFAMSKR